MGLFGSLGKMLVNVALEEAERNKQQDAKNRKLVDFLTYEQLENIINDPEDYHLKIFSARDVEYVKERIQKINCAYTYIKNNGFKELSNDQLYDQMIFLSSYFGENHAAVLRPLLVKEIESRDHDYHSVYKRIQRECEESYPTNDYDFLAEICANPQNYIMPQIKLAQSIVRKRDQELANIARNYKQYTEDELFQSINELKKNRYSLYGTRSVVNQVYGILMLELVARAEQDNLVLEHYYDSNLDYSDRYDDLSQEELKELSDKYENQLGDPDSDDNAVFLESLVFTVDSEDLCDEYDMDYLDYIYILPLLNEENE